MEDKQLNELWQQYDAKLQEARILNLQSWVLNLQQFERLQKEKASRKLRGITGIKLLGVVLGLAWSIFLLFLVWHSLHWSRIFFVVSLTAIALITLYAVIMYVGHLALINQINNEDAVLAQQEKISRLQASTLHVCRILFLQMPFYCFWFITPEMLQDEWLKNLLITLPITIGFTWLAVWLYRNISVENTEKKWFRILFSSREWTYPVKALKILGEIEEYKRSVVVN